MSSARTFLKSIIDYAGLFPPAKLHMNDAVSEYAKYRDGAYSDLLGRFIIPAFRLEEFSASAVSLARESAPGPWRLSAIVTAGNELELGDVDRFNTTSSADSSSPGATIDAIEMAVQNDSDVRWAAEHYQKSYELFLEPSGAASSSVMLHSISAAGAAAKLRTGGTVQGSIPPAKAVMRFINDCAELNLRFKATAGLHHAICGEYPLTYEPGATRSTMFGYLNVFLVAAFRRAGLAEAALFDLLQESDATSIMFNEAGAWWRGNLAETAHLMATRKFFAVSFGSCSFTEPVGEARDLQLI